MNRAHLQYSILFLFFVIPSIYFSQAIIKKAKKSHAEYDYYKVIETIGAADGLNADMLRKLSDSYKMAGQYDQAENIYSLIIQSGEKNPEDHIQYAQLLKLNGKYAEANEQLDIYTNLKPDELRVELYQMNKKYNEELVKDKGQFKLHVISGNSYQQDFGIAFYKNKLVFTSTRQALGPMTRLWNGNKLPYLDIYTAKVNPKYELKSISKFPEFNKKYHDGPVCFNKKGNQIIITSDNYSGKDKEGVRKLKLYEASIEKGGEWGNKTALPFNSDEFSCGHPSLNANGNILYFTSDMPGGFGGTDLYKSIKNEKGVWSKPINLGEKINTEGNESFPFIHESGLFFFSSDGRPGLGGLDLFVTQIVEDYICKPINVAAPVNTARDDFNMILDAEKKKGFFSSNRLDGKGSDDIYAFDLLKPFYFGKMIKGIVKSESGEPLYDVAIYLMDKKGGIIEKVCTKKDGSYVLFAEEGKQYKVLAKTEDYYDTRKNLSTAGNEEFISGNLTMEKDPGFILYALISNSKTKQPMDGVKLKLSDKRGKTIQAITSANGEYRLPLPDRKLGDTLNYTIEINKPGYVSKTVDLKWPLKKRGEQKIHEKLDISLSKVELGGDLAKMTNLQNIYFDLGKWSIREDAALELDKIVKIMNENTEMVVELGSHTDCRSSKAYNLKLSEQRAKASAEYIRKRIVNPQRISGKGYGESKLLNNCSCEGKTISHCTEEEHQINRRTEFIIVKLLN